VGERWSADIWGRPGQCRPPCGLRGAVGPLGGAITPPGGSARCSPLGRSRYPAGSGSG